MKELILNPDFSNNVYCYNNCDFVIEKFFQWEIDGFKFKFGMVCHEQSENNPVKFLNDLQMFIFLSSYEGKANMSPLNEELPQAVSQPWNASRHQFLDEMLNANVSWLFCLIKLVYVANTVMCRKITLQLRLFVMPDIVTASLNSREMA